MHPQQIGEIVRNAIFLHEILNDSVFETSVNDLEGINPQLERWCQVIAQGNWETFGKRLEWSGWSLETVNEILGTEINIERFSMADWAVTLTNFIVDFPALPCKPDVSPLQEGDPLPFEDILLPLVLFARKQLLVRLNVSSLSPGNLPLEILSESAYLNLERELLRRLLNIASQTLDFEFARNRTAGENLLNLILENGTGTASNTKYIAYTHGLLSDSLLSFFQRYPVLARSLATVVNFWVEAVGEFLERLQSDLTEICTFFNAESAHNPGKVIRAETGVSDPHNCGRGVIILTFESSFRIVYKPKCLQLESTYNSLLDSFNSYLRQHNQGRNDDIIDFRILKILSRDSYGWIEFVEQKSCSNENQARRFYLRAGMLLCLLYMLGATDCHSENLIANGEYPVLVDLETVMQHQVSSNEGISEKSAALIAHNHLQDSVLRTGLLPFWEFRPGNSTAYDYSAFGNTYSQTTREPVPIWKFINTDNMRQAREVATIPPQENVPMINEMPISPNTYLQELEDGFKIFYDLLIYCRDDLLGSNSLLAAFCSTHVRFIFRPTRVYAKLLQSLIKPSSLRNGLDWSIELDILSRTFLDGTENTNNWILLSAEIRSLCQFDFPYFMARVNSKDLAVETGELARNFFESSCYDQVLSRLNSMNNEDLEVQTRIIQLVFHSKVARTSEFNPSASTLDKARSIANYHFDTDELVQYAHDIALKLGHDVITGSDGSATWIGLTFIPSVERFQIQPLGSSLYEGYLGTALFLAAMQYVKPNTRFGELALQAVLPIRRVLSGSHNATAIEFAHDIGIGGAKGIGSVIYSLAKISKFLDIPELLHDALRASELLTLEIVALDNSYDVIGGAAGAILSLLALYSQTNELDLLTRAVYCGNHLLKYCQTAYAGYSDRTKGRNSKPMSGFSHGAAGIAYSLFKLYEVTQDRSYFETACQAIAYERSIFSPSRRNWPFASSVPSSSDEPVFWSTWCYGAPGIGLGRAGGLSLYGSEDVLAEIEIAIETTRSTNLQDIDHLCCGNMGRAEVLLATSRVMSRPDWHQEANKLAAIVIQRSLEKGGYQLFPELPPSVFNPSFFQGAAGIGYQLLRLACPDSLPSILMWE